MRKRVNISIDPTTYAELQRLTRLHGFRTPCEMVTALVHVLLDRLALPEDRRLDLPADDDKYILSMFDDLSHRQPQPCGEVPKRHHKKTLNDYGEG